MSAYTDFDGMFLRVPGTDLYTASKDLTWDIGRLGSSLTITVPASYRHDVSVPGWLTFAFARHDPRFQRAARLHDWLLDQGWSAWTASAVFYDALKADGVPHAKRWAMATAVLIHVAGKSDPLAPAASYSRSDP